MKKYIAQEKPAENQKINFSDYSPEEIQQKFSESLKELLKEYGAEITLENLAPSPIQEDTIVVNFDYREDLFEKHNTGIIPELILGRYVDGN